MIIHDYECQKCGKVTEHYIVDLNNIPNQILCPICGETAKKIISMSQTSPIDSEWIRSVLEVVEKGSDKPHCNEFLKNPTRANYGKWLKNENFRHLERGEKPRRPIQTPDTATITDMMMKHRQEKRAICLRK